MAATALPSGLISKPNLPVLQRGHPLAQGLVGAWLFTDSGAITTNTGNQQYSIRDWSDNRFTGLSTPLSSGVTIPMKWGDGLLGRTFLTGATAPGQEARIDIVDSRFTTIMNNNEFSFAGWVRCDDGVTDQFYYLLTCPAYDTVNEPFTIRINLPNMEVSNFNAGAPFTSPLTTTLNFTGVVPIWFHFVVSFSKKRSAVTFYLNGKFNNSSLVSGSYSFTNTTNTLSIGGAGLNINNRPWLGAFDSIMMWNRGLSDDDARLLYSDHYAMFRVPSLAPPFRFVTPPPTLPLMGQIWLA
jgi:hypothetical protein